MSLTLDNSGTTTLTGGGTLDTLVSTNTNVGFMNFLPDLTNMANGDIIEFFLSTKVLSGGAFSQVWKASFSHVQINKIPLFPAIPSDIDFKIQAKQSAGTGRSIPWKNLRA